MCLNLLLIKYKILVIRLIAVLTGFTACQTLSDGKELVLVTWWANQLLQRKGNQT